MQLKVLALFGGPGSSLTLTSTLDPPSSAIVVSTPEDFFRQVDLQLIFPFLNYYGHRLAPNLRQKGLFWCLKYSCNSTNLRKPILHI